MRYLFFLFFVLFQCQVIQPEKDNNQSQVLALAAILATSQSGSSSAANTGTSASDEEFSTVKGITSEHNRVRALEGVNLPNLVWNSTVAAYSKSKVEYLANNGCKLDHYAGPKNPGYGENLFWGSGSSWTPAYATKSWYDEKVYYTYSTNTCATGKVCGHYTQVVWKNSTKLGCAMALCLNNGGMIYGCNYDPPGNYTGQKPY